MVGANGSPRGPRDTRESISIPDALRQLQEIVSQLHEAFPHKKFTLDGRLVGDLREILVVSAYDIKLFWKLEKHHDGVTSDGRLVQIKTTLKDSLTFPCNYVPDYYLGIKIKADGSFQEIYNGPGRLIESLVTNLKPTQKNLHSISISRLLKLNEQVPDNERIPSRATR